MALLVDFSGIGPRDGVHPSTAASAGTPALRSLIKTLAEVSDAVRRRNGFTLIEMLAALAISAVIIVGTVALIHTVAGNFDRGTRGVDAADRLMLAIERLAADFSSARFVVWTTENGPAVAFKGEPAADDKPAQIMFVGAGGTGYERHADEVVSLTIEQVEGATRLVRRSARWAGPDTSVDHVPLHDAVVLIEGNLDISFRFGRLEPSGALVWSASWVGQTTLPHFVRLILRDRVTGSDPVGEADFIVRADAPLACGRPNAGTDCLSRVLPTTKRPVAPERSPG
ncbi:MAG TPA: prepilin-type N-terminal cleavage/methylation domain-containing protein [Xanthobacteraceae bacterium]|jgi:prepilin-type N-terminal cleavage/methylation domain-containing protein